MIPFVTFVAFDLETTGLDAEKEEIVEVAGLKFTLEKKDGKLQPKILGAYSSFVKPSKFIPEEATRIHKITNQMVEEAPELKLVLTQFLRFCGLSSILVAHNASFDAAFMSKGIRKLGMVMPQNPIIDSLKVVRKILPEYASHKLGDLAKKLSDQMQLSVNPEQLHRAAYDCEVLKEVLCACLRKRYQEKDLAMDKAIKSLEAVHGQVLSFVQFA